MLLNQLIQQHLGQQIKSSDPISTGIFNAYQVTLANGKMVFIKYQNNSNDLLIKEARELTLLSQFIKTPAVLISTQYCLILEWIESSYNPHTQSQLGEQLANLHQQKSTYFGFEFDNKIGDTFQPNAADKKITNWAEFYWQYRLLFQIDLANKNSHLNSADYRLLRSLEAKLPDLLDFKITPSLLHGDLWSGNYISNQHDTYFIDTACYYGHREIDFALSFMFGGFSAEFYSSYQAHYPLDSGFEQRKPLYMLYHYLNHLNIFGSSYHANTMHCVKQLLD